MAIKDSATEELIKDTAKRLFFGEGRLHATTQEIAEAAQVNRTLVHYYFRSRDLLFEQILQEARAKMNDRVRIFFSELGFREKVEKFIDMYLEDAVHYPFLDSYVVGKMNERIAAGEPIHAESHDKEQAKAFFAIIENAMKKKEIHTMEPIQFFLNLFSLMAHPLSLQPIYKVSFNISDKQFRKLMKDRKEIILKLLFLK